MVFLMQSGPRRNCLVTESGRVLARVQDDDPDPVATVARFLSTREEEDFPEVSGILYYYCTYLYIYLYFLCIHDCP